MATSDFFKYRLDTPYWFWITLLSERLASSSFCTKFTIIVPPHTVMVVPGFPTNVIGLSMNNETTYIFSAGRLIASPLLDV